MGNNTRQNFAPSVWKDVAETKAGGGVIGTPGTPAVKEAWWEKGAAALAANTIPKMFDYIVDGASASKPTAKYGGEGRVEYDKNPGQAYGQGNSLFKSMYANNKTDFDANEAQYQAFKKAKIAQAITTGDTNEELGDKYFDDNASRGMYDSKSPEMITDEQGWTRQNPHYSPGYNSFMDRRQLVQKRQKDLEKRHTKWRRSPNVGDNLIKGSPFIPNFMEKKDLKKGQSLYKDTFDKLDRDNTSFF